jgi:VCBS repeat protein
LLIHSRGVRVLVLILVLSPMMAAESWSRHVIDDTSQGADGVRLADVNGDGFADIATGWEEGGVIRVYLNPGPFKARTRWPKVTVGQVASPEDAVFGDMDGDGTTDVVSSCEGQERTVYFHWAPARADDYEFSDRWVTTPLKSSEGVMQWMYAIPMEVDFRRGIDLVVGAKGPGARIGWFEAPEDARSEDWIWHALYEAGWVMSLISSDMDGDGDTDVLASDRRGPNSGALWLENPGPGPDQMLRWPVHRIGPVGRETMFITEADVDGDGLVDVISAVRPDALVIHSRRDRDGRAWSDSEIRLPEGVGTAKAVEVGDLDLDGDADLLFSCERAEGELSGLMWFSYNGSSRDIVFQNISGPTGVKFDRMELLDLDGDGDLDILTCEERENLGVIWYENPTR